MIKGANTSHHGLNVVGYGCATCSYTKRCKNVNLSKSNQNRIKYGL